MCTEGAGGLCDDELCGDNGACGVENHHVMCLCVEGTHCTMTLLFTIGDSLEFKNLKNTIYTFHCAEWAPTFAKLIVFWNI